MADLGTNIWMTLDEIRTALVEAIDAAGLEQPCMVAVMPGEEVALDYCQGCTNGMAWVRLVTLARLENQNTGVESLGACASGFTAILEMGWMRGGPIVELDETGSLVEVPDVAALDGAAIQQFADMQIMVRSLCAVRLKTGWKPKATGYTPFGPQGGCYGGLWAISIPVE